MKINRLFLIGLILFFLNAFFLSCNNGSSSGSNKCGNGILDPGETCDGDCPQRCDDDDPCTEDSLIGRSDECSAVCRFDTITTCSDNDDCCPVDCQYRNDADCPVCQEDFGAYRPIPVCSPEDPCTNLLSLYGDLEKIESPSDIPTCHQDDSLGEWVDQDETSRYYCEFRPEGTSSDSKRPLVIFIPGSGGSARTVYESTSLHDKAYGEDPPDFYLSGDSGRPGFILISAQPRNLHWPTVTPKEGAKHDIYYRDMATDSDNRDFAFYDHIIDALAAEEVIDTSRIYLIGWSNGAHFALLYGIARHTIPTPDNHRITAVALYSAGDPFENTEYDQDPSCQLAPYPTSTLPIYLISRACDIIACNPAQDENFRNIGYETTPGHVVSTWIGILENMMANPNVKWSIIENDGSLAGTYPGPNDLLTFAEVTCAPPDIGCGITRAAINHLRWPNGVNDSGGHDHEPAMLAFLKAYADTAKLKGFAANSGRLAWGE